MHVVDPPTLTRDLTDTCAPYLQAGSPALSLRGRLVSTYATREALLDTLLASCYIPMYYETPTLLAGRLHLDGGLFDNQPVLPGGVTVTVSPAQHAATISPHVRCAALKAQLIPSPTHPVPPPCCTCVATVQTKFNGVHRLFPPDSEAEVEELWRHGYQDGNNWAARAVAAAGGPVPLVASPQV